MFCVGDLVDRGEDNLEILGKQLDWNSFHSIICNHEVMLMEAFENNQQDQDFDIYSFGRSSTAHAANGGKWFSMLRPATREQAVWGRAVLQDFLAGRDVAPVNGIDAVVHGHTLVTQPIEVANRLYIDTGLERRVCVFKSITRLNPLNRTHTCECKVCKL